MRDAGLHYCLFDPTGNITALVESAVEVPDQPAVAAGIMCRHPEVEQVGFLSLPAFPALPFLRMAGGEFCGNASMCAAALTALRRGMKPGTGSSLLLRVSGALRPVAVCLQEEGEGCWSASVTMPPARSVEEQAFRFGNLQGICRGRFPWCGWRASRTCSSSPILPSPGCSLTGLLPSRRCAAGAANCRRTVSA